MDEPKNLPRLPMNDTNELIEAYARTPKALRHQAMMEILERGLKKAREQQDQQSS